MEYEIIERPGKAEWAPGALPVTDGEEGDERADTALYIPEEEELA